MHRKPSWSDCFPLEIYWTWIVAGIVAGGLLLVSECAPTPAHADGLTLDLGIGQTIFQQTSQDGLWHQTPLPHAWDKHETAWKVGLGYQWEHWGLSAAMVNLGSIKVKAGFVGDEHFDPVHHVCLAMCDKLSWLEASDQIRAYELVASYRWLFGKVAPYIGFGGAMMTHRFTVHNGNDYQQLYGRVPATATRVGVCYGTGIQACLESTYYKQIKGVEWFGNPMYPLFENALVSLVTMRVPI